MTRFVFLGLLALSLAWETVASESAAGLRAVDRRSPPAGGGGTVWQSPRALPVAGRAQVLVVGGTFSGTAAAWTAAQQGAQTVLLAEDGFLGGLATAGLKAVFNEEWGPYRRSRLLSELLTVLRPEGVVGHGCFDPEYAKWALDRLTQEAGVKVLFHSQPVGAVLCGRRVVGAVVLGPEGRRVYLADAIIDATEEAVLLAAAAPPCIGPPLRPTPRAIVTFFHWSGGWEKDQEDTKGREDAKCEDLKIQRGQGDCCGERFLQWYSTPWPDEILGRLMWIATGSYTSGDYVTRIEITARQEIDRLTSLRPPPSPLVPPLPSFPFSPSSFVSLVALRSHICPPAPLPTQQPLTLADDSRAEAPSSLRKVVGEGVWRLVTGRVPHPVSQPDVTLRIPREATQAQNVDLYVTGGDVLALPGQAWVEDLDLAATLGEVAAEAAVADLNAASGTAQVPPISGPSLACEGKESPVTRKTRPPTPLRLRPSSPGDVAEWENPMQTGSPEFVPEAGRFLPVLGKAAVVVAGGGLAATAAAIAAARGGATVLLAGPHAFLGGRATAEGVQMFMPQPGLGGLYAEFMEQLLAREARFPDSFVVDPEAVKAVLQEMALAAGVRLRLQTRPAGIVLEGRRVTGVVVEGPEGRGVLQAQVVIDATRDGDMAAAAGAPFTKGREPDGLTQPSTLMYTLLQTGPRVGLTEDLRFGYVMPRGRVVRNTTRVRNDGLNVELLSHAERVGRQQMIQQVRTLRAQYDYRLLHSGPEVFVRETRHILGDYVLTLEDLKQGTIFPDTVVLCDYPMDIHNVTGGPGGRLEQVPQYGIPYRCLLPRDVENLLVAGRTISGTHEAFGSFRIESTSLALGEAAGTAAALSVQRHTCPRHLPAEVLRAELRRRGNNCGPDRWPGSPCFRTPSRLH